MCRVLLPSPLHSIQLFLQECSVEIKIPFRCREARWCVMIFSPFFSFASRLIPPQVSNHLLLFDPPDRLPNPELLNTLILNLNV